MSTPELAGDALIAQRLLQRIFDGGCRDTCIGACACRDEIALALATARRVGRVEARDVDAA